MEEKWNNFLIKNNDINSLFTFLKFLCSIRDNLTLEFKDRIINDLIEYNYLPSDIFNVNDKYNDILFYINMLNQNKYNEILKNEYNILF